MVASSPAQPGSGEPSISDGDSVAFLQWALLQLHMRWPGYRKVRRQVIKRVRRRLAQLDLPGLAAYRQYLQQHPSEWGFLDTFCRISISRFYRDRDVFNYLGDRVLPELAHNIAAGGQPQLRCWSAGCASGEEPYTVAIIWKQRMRDRFPQLRFRVIATDADAQLLSRARAATYQQSSLKDLPEDWRQDVFSRSGEDYCLLPELRDMVEFRQQDIRQELPPEGFHLILCRHFVFTYFDESLQRDTLQRIMGRLLPGGFLVAAKKEYVPAENVPLTIDQDRLGVYSRMKSIGP